MDLALAQPVIQHGDAPSPRDAMARAFARHGVTRCAILASTFRSGSTWIGRIMDRHGLAGMKHERLRSIAAGDDLDRFFDAALAEQSSPVFATRLMWVQRNRLAHLLGFPRADSTLFAAQFPDAAWLFLRRRDVYAQGISYWRAKATNRWHVPPVPGETEPTVPYDFAEIDACVRELVLHDRLWDDFFALAGIAPTTVWYEDLLTDCTPIERTMARFGLLLPETFSNLKIQSDARSERYRDRYLDDLFRRSKGLDHAVKAAAP